MRIKVTQADIDAGKPRKCGQCPLALALIRRLKPVADTLTVAGKISYLDTKGNHRIAYTPDEAYNFWTDFDAGRPVKPFSFNLKI
jgi:hypothetical protein